jgi:TonB family protein
MSDAEASAVHPAAAPGHVWAPHGSQDIQFLLERRQQRLGGAFGASILSHIIVVALVIAIARALPESATSALPDLKNYNIVWLPAPGPGGGGGGGGNKMKEPPRKAELPGKDQITVPAAKPPEFVPNKEVPDELPPAQDLTIPAKTLGADEQTLPGVLEGTDVNSLSQGSGEGGGAGSGRGTGIGPGEGSGLGPGYGGGTGGGAYRPGNGVELPRVIREVKPQYTADAMRAKVQGTVLLEAVVMPDGSVGKVEVMKSLDPVFGLDQEAIKAAKQWRFVPGMRLGQPVPVIVTIELTFTLR